jgi:hypothetical protein
MIETIMRLLGLNGMARNREQKRQSRERLDAQATKELRVALAHNRRVTTILEDLVQGAQRRTPARAKRRRGT